MKNYNMLSLVLVMIYSLIAIFVAAVPIAREEIKTLESRGNALVALCENYGWRACKAVLLGDRRCSAAPSGMHSINFPVGVTCNLWSTSDCTYPGGDFDLSFITLSKASDNLANVGRGWDGRVASLQCWSK